MLVSSTMKVIHGIIFFALIASVCISYLSLGKGEVQNRHIASIDLDFDGDYSYLSGEAFKNAVSRRIVEESFVEVTDSNEIIVNVAAFKLTSDDQNHIDSCQVYSSLQMQFYAEGVAISGEIPNLYVEADCALTDPDYIQSLVIPKDRIKSLLPDEVVDTVIDYQGTKMVFSFLGNFWPSTWIAYELVFVSSTDDVDDLVIKIESPKPETIFKWTFSL